MATVLEARHLSKNFGHLQALSDVSLSIHAGEVVGLVGDNGAGKSTLISLLSGTARPTLGELYVAGSRVSFTSPAEARAAGIETIYQDLALSLHLPIWANVALGREKTKGGRVGHWLGWLDTRIMEEQAQAGLKRTGIGSMRASTVCEELSGGQRQAVAVARAISWDAKILLMDEPTAALGVAEQETIGRLIISVRDAGVGVLLISHNLPQVHDICSRVIVLRHGRIAATPSTREVSPSDLVGLITGASKWPGHDSS